MNALLLLAIVGDPGMIQGPPRNQAETVTVFGDCPAPLADDACLGQGGIAGGNSTSTTDPSGFMVRPAGCWPGDGTCTASELCMAGGQDTTTIAIDGADPSVSCAGDNDTVSVIVCDRNCACATTVLTEGTDWEASAVVADTCTSLASAVDGVAGVSASCTSPNVRLVLEPTHSATFLAESTAGCTTVDDGTLGPVIVLNDNTNAVGAGLIFRYGPGTAGTDEGHIYHTGNTFHIIQRDSGGMVLGAPSFGFSTAAGGATAVAITGTLSATGTVTFNGIDNDVDGTCADGLFEIDTGGATVELCYCNGANTPVCVALAAGPTD